VLIVTSEWPRFPGDIVGIHVKNQVNQLKAAGISVQVFPFWGHKNPLRYAWAILKLWKMPLHSFDLIHAHHGQSGVVALVQNKLPVVVTFHGSDLQGIRDLYGRVTFLGRILQWVSHVVAYFANEVILVSEHLKSYIPKRIYHVIPAGIDVEIFFPIRKDEARAKLNLSQDHRLVLFIGDSSRTEKRFWLANEVVKSIDVKCDIELVIVSGVSHDTIPLYMNACDVLLITSSSEGSPTILREALACLLPIVSVDVGDVRAQLEKIDGCIVTKDDRIDTIASALIPILEHPYRLRPQSKLSDFDEKQLVQKVITVYEKVLQSEK
jgi:glycosyltransferase involved in cell wall biosynthesis